MELLDHMMQLERRLANGRGAEYDEILADDAVVVVPGMVLDKAGCVAAMDESPGWDRVELSDPQLIAREGLAALVYRFSGWRGDTTYRAVLSSSYARHDGDWRLVLHQQTPEGSGTTA